MVTMGYFFGAEWAHLSARVPRMMLVGLEMAVIVPAVVVAVARRRA